MKLDLAKASLSLVTFGCQSQFPLGLNLLCLETTLTSEKSSSRGTEKGVKARTAQAPAVKLSAITSPGQARAHSTKLSPGPSLSGGLYKSQGHQKAVSTKYAAFCLKLKSCYSTLFPQISNCRLCICISSSLVSVKKRINGTRISKRGKKYPMSRNFCTFCTIIEIVLFSRGILLRLRNRFEVRESHSFWLTPGLLYV